MPDSLNSPKHLLYALKRGLVVGLVLAVCLLIQTWLSGCALATNKKAVNFRDADGNWHLVETEEKIPYTVWDKAGLVAHASCIAADIITTETVLSQGGTEQVPWMREPAMRWTLWPAKFVLLWYVGEKTNSRWVNWLGAATSCGAAGWNTTQIR